MHELKLEWAELVPGTEVPAGDGINGALRCLVRVRGRPISAYLKRGKRSEVLTEAFCAVLLTGWGLRVPQPYLVREGDTLAFASANAGYPNLAQRLGIRQLADDSPELQAAEIMASYLVCTFGSTPLAIAADEAIANTDRNFGNVLWDGTNEAWIDHAYSLGNHGDRDDINKLCMMACACGEHDRIQKGAIAEWAAADRSLPQRAADLVASMAGDMSGSAEFVRQRLSNLGCRLIARFPAPDDLLSRV